MTQTSQDKTIPATLADIGKLLGSPPVLSSESMEAYEQMMSRLVQCFMPRDFMEQMLIRHLADCTWEVLRYTRHKTLTMERKFIELQESQVKRVKAAAEQKADRARRLAEQNEEPPRRPEELADDAVAEVDGILARQPVELDHARALEATAQYHDQVDKWLNNATARRNDALDQLERYREGLGLRMRQVSDAVIDAEFSDLPAEQMQVAAPGIVSEETP